jgi:hypothetical protein
MAFVLRFTAHCIGSDPLNVREQLERFANEQWLPEHTTLERGDGDCSRNNKIRFDMR